MSINKLSSLIRREMTGDPKKAVILAGLLLLACYYWAPLVWGWVSKGGTNQQEAQLAALAAPDDLGQVPTVETDVPTGADNTHAPLHRWQVLARWIDADPRTKPLLRVSGRRDPFTDQSTARRIADGSATVLNGPITPKNLGMRLTGIMISSRRRVALIDGKAYVAGERIPVKLTSATKQQETQRDVKTDDDASRTSQGKVEKPRIEKPKYVNFRLAEVRQRSVVLWREEKSYELELPGPEPNDDAFVISYPNRKPTTGP